MTVWIPVSGYEGLYSINENGHVYGHKRNKLIKPYINQSGYKKCALSKNSIVKHVSVHRILAATFLENAENKPQVNHMDGNKLNNNLSNLEWVTGSENIQHAFATGLSGMTEEQRLMQGNWFKRKVFCLDKSSGKEFNFDSETAACKYFGFSKGTISRYIKGSRKSPENLTFSYIGGK